MLSFVKRTIYQSTTKYICNGHLPTQIRTHFNLKHFPFICTVCGEKKWKIESNYGISIKKKNSIILSASKRKKYMNRECYYIWGCDDLIIAHL